MTAREVWAITAREVTARAVAKRAVAHLAVLAAGALSLVPLAADAEPAIAIPAKRPPPQAPGPVAIADPRGDDAGESDESDDISGLQVGFDIAVGGLQTGDEWVQAGGFGARVGYRWPRLAIRAEIDGWQISDDDDGDRVPERHGFTARIGASLSTAFMTARIRSWLDTSLWIEAGAGWQKLWWHDGQPAARPSAVPDLSLGVASHLTIGDGAANSQSRRFGIFLNIKCIVPDVKFPETGILFSIGYVWLK